MESKASQPKITSLPQELITAILVRLPLKNILQLKCVSKDWLSLISSPFFANTHLHFSANKDLRMLLLCPFEQKVKYCLVSSLFDVPLNIDPLKNPEPYVDKAALFNRPSIEAFDLVHPLDNPDPSIVIAGSVNGLICLHKRRDNRLILWNPLTRKVKQVPELIPPDTNSMYLYYRFMYGFGYDEVHDDYKVVAINHNGSAIGFIYSLKSDSWSNLDVLECLVKFDDWAKSVNGKVHWVTGTAFTSRGDDGWGIMSIDLVDEKCGKVELPCYEQGKKDVRLGVLGNDLSMLCSYIRNNERTPIDLWVMKEYGVKESWMKLYSIKYRNESGYYLTAPLCMSNKGESLFVSGSYVMIYNPEKKSIRYLKIINVQGGFRAELYIESLVCPILQNEPMT